MAEGFGLKIGLEGEREFKASLREINSEFKVLGSEMKLVDSQFAKNDTSTERLAARNEVLGREIEAQKSKIATLRDALENASTSFGESDRRTQAWQVQLNHAQAALNGMEREVEDNNAALAKADTEMGQAANAANQLETQLDQAGDGAADSEGKFSKLGSVAKGLGAALGTAFVAVGAASIGAAKGLSSMAVGSAAYADDILTTSTVTGVSAEKLQAYSYAAELVDVSVETMTKSMAKNIKSMAAAQNGTKLAVEAYDKLGISVTDSSGQLRDSETVYWEAIDALGKIPNETERDAIAFQLFGKSAQELNPLIAQGSAGMAELTGEAERMGAVFSAETLAKLGEFDDSIQRLKAGAGAAKNALGTVLLPELQTLADNGVTLLGEFTSGIVAANGDWTEISQVVASTVQGLASSVLGTLPDILEVAKGIVSGLGSAILENLPALIETATQIIVFLVQALIEALPGLTEGALQLVLGLVTAIIENLSLLLDAALQMIVTLATGLAEAMPELIPAIVGMLTSLIQIIIENLPLLLEAALQLVMGLAQGIIEAIPVLVAALPGLIQALVSFLVTAIPQIIQAGIQLLTALVTALPQIISAITAALPQIITAIVGGITGSIPQLVQAGVQLLVALIRDLPLIITTIVKALPQIISAIVKAILASIPELVAAGVELLVALIQNLPLIIAEIVKAIPQIISGIVGAVAQGIPQMASIGGDLVRGLWNGIQSLAGWLWNQVSGWITGIWDGILGFFGIHSPSKEMAWVGAMLAKGLAGGIEANTAETTKAASNLATDTLATFQELTSGIEVPLDIQAAAAALPTITTTREPLTVQPSGGGLAGSGGSGDLSRLIEQTARTVLSGLDVQVVLDDGTLVGKLAPAIDQRIAVSARRRAGRLGGVYA